MALKGNERGTIGECDGMWNKGMTKIEIEWLCENAHLHSNYPFVGKNLEGHELDLWAVEWLKTRICECGGKPHTFAVFTKGQIEGPYKEYNPTEKQNKMITHNTDIMYA